MPVNMHLPFGLTMATVQTFAPVLVILLFVLFALPKASHLFFLQYMRGVTRAKLGEIDFIPGPVESKQHFKHAASAVQRALSAHHHNFHYNIKVVHVDQPIEQAIRVEGVTMLQLARKSNLQTRFDTGQSKATSLQMLVRVDVSQLGDHSRVSWRFLPSDPSLFQAQTQIHDPNVDYLVARTNYALLKELKPLC